MTHFGSMKGKGPRVIEVSCINGKFCSVNFSEVTSFGYRDLFVLLVKFMQLYEIKLLP